MKIDKLIIYGKFGKVIKDTSEVEHNINQIKSDIAQVLQERTEFTNQSEALLSVINDYKVKRN